MLLRPRVRVYVWGMCWIGGIELVRTLFRCQASIIGINVKHVFAQVFFIGSMTAVGAVASVTSVATAGTADTVGAFGTVGGSIAFREFIVTLSSSAHRASMSFSKAL